MAIEVGNVFEGRVTGVKPFGAFVALPEGRVGMVHISEVSNEFVQDIAAVLHDGDIVKVQVINIAPDGKIALSIKRLLPPPPRPAREGRGPAGGPRSGGPRPGGPREGGHFGAGRGGAGRPPREGGRGPARDSAPRVWQPKAPVRSDNMSFEDMMSRFKSQSEEKMADLDHETNNPAAVVMRLAAAVAAAERKGLRFSSRIKITETDLSHLIGQVCFFRNKRKETQCLQNLN